MACPEHKTNQVSALLKFPDWLTITYRKKPILLGVRGLPQTGSGFPLQPLSHFYSLVTLYAPATINCLKFLVSAMLTYTFLLFLYFGYFSSSSAWISPIQYARFRLHCFFQKPFSTSNLTLVMILCAAIVTYIITLFKNFCLDPIFPSKMKDLE